MTTPNDPSGDLKSPANAILDVDGLAALMGISAASIPTQRSRSPHKLPPPYLSRPLRWRRETVLKWMAEQEAAAREDAERVGAAHTSPKGWRKCTTPVRQVWSRVGPVLRGMDTQKLRNWAHAALAFAHSSQRPTFLPLTRSGPLGDSAFGYQA